MAATTQRDPPNTGDARFAKLLRRRSLLAGVQMLAILALVVCGAGALAATPDECAAEPKDAVRLACYDAVFRRVPPTPEATFGAEQVARAAKRPPPPAPTADLQASIASITRRPHGELTLVLANGQVWTQTEAQRKPYRVGELVTIRRTPLSGYLLTSEHGVSSRVKRVQ